MKRVLLVSLSALAGTLMPVSSGALAAAGEARDPEAMKALSAMGSALQAKSHFAVRADISTEEVLDDGQKLQRSAIVDMVVNRPNAFKVSIRDGREDRDLFYDGKTFTVFAPDLGHYAAFDAPSTIAETLDVASENFGIRVPLADLFIWGTDEAPFDKVQSAIQVGSDMIGGRDCAHYAMRQADIDWQLWLDDSKDSLPCKVVITSKADPAMPQFTAVYSWRASDAQSADLSFSPPTGSSKISFELTARKQGN